MWTIKLSKQAASFIKDYGGKQARLFEAAFEQLSTDPYSGKSLVGELKGYWSYRIGQFRIIYSIRKTEIIIEALRVQHRREVYEKLKRI